MTISKPAWHLDNLLLINLIFIIFRPKNASEILTSELDNSSSSNGNGNDIFSDYMNPKRSSAILTPNNKPKDQLKYV